MLYGTIPAGHFSCSVLVSVSFRSSDDFLKVEDVTYVCEGSRLCRHRRGGGRGRGAGAALVVEGVARVRVGHVVALHGMVVEDARRRGGEAEAQARGVGVAELEAAAVRC